MIAASKSCATCLCDVLGFIFQDFALCQDEVAPETVLNLAVIEPVDEHDQEAVTELQEAFVDLSMQNGGMKRDLTGDACDQCFNCFADIENAIVECADNATTTVECVEDGLETAADCTICICDLIDVFWGTGEGSCAEGKRAKPVKLY